MKKIFIVQKKYYELNISYIPCIIDRIYIIINNVYCKKNTQISVQIR